MFENTKDILDYCRDNNLSIAEFSLMKEAKLSNTSPEEIKEGIRSILRVMEASCQEGLDREMESLGGLIGAEAYRVENYRRDATTYNDSFILSAVAMSLSTSQVNACMGKIVAAPTAGASGILPAVLFSSKERFQLEEEEMIQALLTSSLVGEIIARKATISGAEGGCQAECGAASSMAAAALVYLRKGTNEEIFNAASIALTNVMGLICDPIAGLVEYPCNLRNASGVSNAFLSADLSLAGVKSIVPFDQVVEAMDQVGQLMHVSLKETALGGLATTETGEAIRKSLKYK